MSDPHSAGRRAALLLAGLAAGCSPALDWREVRPEGDAVVALFPCRPDRHAREVTLAGARTRMNLLVCSTAEQTFALSHVDAPDAARAGAALAALRTLAAEHIGAGAPQVVPLSVRGATPDPQAAELRLEGRLPDGNAVRERAVFFRYGSRVYQASVIGRRLDETAAQDFVAGLKLPS